MELFTHLTATKVANFKRTVPGGYELSSGFGVKRPDGALAVSANGHPMLFRRLRDAKSVAEGGLIMPVNFAKSE
tara:strand:- start:13 stop:234 length:222 start_codon:yes stop_codon:yes gene_type:complete